MSIPTNVHSIDEVRKALTQIDRELDMLTAVAGRNSIADIADVSPTAASRFRQEPVEDDFLAWDVKSGAWIYQNATEAGLMGFYNGTFAESFDALATSDGATITMSLEQVGGGNLRMQFSDGYTTLDCTPATTSTIELTAGTDEVPVENYIYVLRSDKILAKSTSGWPAPEHIRVGHFVVPSAPWVQTYGGVYGSQNHNDHESETAGDSIGQGHMTDLSARSRRFGAKWLSGCQGIATQSGDELYISIAAGVVMQMHEHAFAAINSDPGATGDPILVVNDFDTKYLVIDSLNDITKLSDGTNIGNNKYVKFVLIGVASKEGELQLMLVDVPSGQYNTAAGALRDVDGHSNFTIPIAFGLNASTGFLVAAFVCQHTASGMILQSTVDLRGTTPATAPGSGTGGGDVSAAAALADNSIIRGDGGAKDVQDSGAFIDDSGNLTLTGTVDGVDIAQAGSLLPFFNGIFLESFNALVTSAAGTITLSLEQKDGGDLTMVFSDGHTTLDCTPAATIALTAGTDAAPQKNYIYILQSTKVLTKSTTAFPAAEHIKVGYFAVQTAATVATTGELGNQNWNDHASETSGAGIGQGHLTHITEHMRRTDTVYASGIDPGVNIVGASTPDDVFLTTTAGVVWQMHAQAYPAHDSDPGGAGDLIYVANDSVTAYDTVNNLNGKLLDATGASMANAYYNLVIWSVANKEGVYSPLMVNLPMGSYSTLSEAVMDVDGYDVSTIPDLFVVDARIGFLIARVTLKHSAAGGGTWVLHNTLDLRRETPQTVGSGGVMSHALLDGSVHNDTALDAVTKGSIIVGNATPKWDELLVSGTDGSVLVEDAAATNGVKWSTNPITRQARLYIENPLATDDYPIDVDTSTDVTITEIYGEVDAATSVTGKLVLRSRTSIFTGGGAEINSSNLAATTSGHTLSAPISGTPEIAAGKQVFWKASAVSGSPAKLIIMVTYTIDK